MLLAGRYRLLETLGEGGAGTVWRARDEMLHRDVAVKDIRVPPGLTDEDRRAFGGRAIQEARSAARLNHPAIVVIHDVVVDRDRPWIVMDLIGGRSLDRQIKDGGPLPPHRVAEIGLRLLGALSAAHAQGMLHHDVKPGNVLLDEHGRALLADFGIAVPAAGTGGTGGTAGSPEPGPSFTTAGSPGYAAPERLSGGAATPASDLWSLAATLYTAVEGRAPFKRELALAVTAAVLLYDPPRPLRAGPVLGPLLLAMLAKDPAARPSPDAVSEALRAVVSQGPDARLGPAPAAPGPQTSPAHPRPGVDPYAMPAQGVGAPSSPTRTLIAAPPSPAAYADVPEHASASGTLPASGHGAARPGKRKPLLVVAGVVLVLAVTGTAGWLALRPDAAPATTTSGTGAVRFPTAPNPCGLLTDGQAGGLLGGATDTSTADGECAWRFRRNGVVWRTVTIQVRAERSGDAARLSLAARRSAQASLRGASFPEITSAVRDVPGTGTDGFAQDVSNSFQKSTTSTVWFRIDNLIAEVRYHRLDGPKVTPAVRRTAESAAALAAEAIGRA
ncbi:serine/threonine-protein kinase [Microtetraspora niveoalba]|uniref:serine/threonine-protein kinase n=1 Tax=Microtetraspora niveoalba TaxID=46175 RepID=UPI001470A83C|nr:serine/threonine-protein kinase [Microtetraspora niveoalba]